MFSNLIFIYFVAALCVSYGYDIKIKCTNIDEYFFAKPGSYCTSYYKCVNQNYSEFKECGPGSMFHFYSQTCTRNPEICYEPICTGRTNGVYADTTHACRRSFTCHSGRVISVDNCPQSQLHNGQQCVNEDLVMCELPHTTAIAYPFAGDQRCYGRPNGSYGIDDCTKYLICREQQVIDIKSCPDGYRYKTELHQCILANQVPYCTDENSIEDDSCKYQNDGYYSDPTSRNCSSYIVCKNGKFMLRQKCSSGTIFNGKMCIPTPLFTCLSTVWNGVNDICKNKINGFYINPIQGCSSYVRCMSERAVEIKECPNEQYFDSEEKNCIYEKFIERQKCKTPIISNDCDNKSQGFYQGPQCKTYYYCFNGFKTEYKCSDDKIFDGENCVSKTSYTCPEDNSCSYKFDGYYKNDEDGCRSYYYCSKGLKIMYACEKDHIFDGTKCVRGNNCNNQYDEICIGKSDGHYADLKSNCRNYVYCDKGQKIVQLTCRGNRIFNGEKCVNPNLYTCPSQENHLQLNCISKYCVKKECNHINGFFIDIESECRNYFFCIDGKKSILSCNSDQLFNGQICISQDKFTCPIYCNDYENFLKKNLSCPLSG